MTNTWNICQGKSYATNRASPVEVMCAAASKAVGLAKGFRVSLYAYHCIQQMADKELEDLLSALLGLGLVLIPFFMSMSPCNGNVYPLGKQEECNLFLFLMRADRYEFA